MRNAVDEVEHLALLGRPRLSCGRADVRGPSTETSPEDGIMASGENGNGAVPVFDGKADLRSEAFADPVLLHGDDLLRPSGQLIAVE